MDVVIGIAVYAALVLLCLTAFHLLITRQKGLKR